MEGLLQSVSTVLTISCPSTCHFTSVLFCGLRLEDMQNEWQGLEFGGLLQSDEPLRVSYWLSARMQCARDTLDSPLLSASLIFVSPEKYC
jgi:hypothetical protein